MFAKVPIVKSRFGKASQTFLTRTVPIYNGLKRIQKSCLHIGKSVNLDEHRLTIFVPWGPRE